MSKQDVLKQLREALLGEADYDEVEEIAESLVAEGTDRSRPLMWRPTPWTKLARCLQPLRSFYRIS